MEMCEEQLYAKAAAKPIELRKSRNSSPYAERLLADYHKHLAQDEDRYIYEANHPKNLRGHSKERDHQQDEEDDRHRSCAPR